MASHVDGLWGVFQALRRSDRIGGVFVPMVSLGYYSITPRNCSKSYFHYRSENTTGSGLRNWALLAGQDVQQVDFPLVHFSHEREE